MYKLKNLKINKTDDAKIISTTCASLTNMYFNDVLQYNVLKVKLKYLFLFQRTEQ